MMESKNLRLERYCLKPYDAVITGKSEPYFISGIVPTQQQWNLFGESLDFGSSARLIVPFWRS